MSTSIGPTPGNGRPDGTGSEDRLARGPAPDRGPAGPRGYNVVRGDHDSVLARQEQEFGGMKFGASFFGWLTATGATVLLGALATALGAAISALTGKDIAAGATQDLQTAGIWGSVVVLLILLLAYFCGGYVAGRMARFNGLKQGVAVWLWSVLVAVIVAVIGLIAGSQVDIVARVPGLEQVPADPAQLTVPAVIAVVVTAIIALVGAILGGRAGMRFHRQVDSAGLR